jgi:hypothetical protein
MGGGRGPETLPANCAKGRERGRGDSEEWPTEYTERGGERWEPRKRKRGQSLFDHERHEKGVGGGRDDGKTKWGLRGCGG